MTNVCEFADDCERKERDPNAYKCNQLQWDSLCPVEDDEASDLIEAPWASAIFEWERSRGC